MEVVGSVLTALAHYIENLDWSFIITFILIAYMINHQKVTTLLFRWFKIKCNKRYRVALVGIVYGTLLYYLRASSFEEAELLFQSFVFAMVFHKLIIDVLVRSVLSIQSNNS